MAEKFDPIPHAERLESGILKEESQMIEAMIRGYCQKNHHPKNGLCQDCKVLLYYAKKRLACCRYEKPIQIYLMTEMAFSSRFIEYGFTRKSSDSHAIACTLPELLFLVGSAPA